jgi:hypothetical protein
MRKTFKLATEGLALAVGLGGGCAVGLTPGSGSDPAQVNASITQSIDRLRALQIFDVGPLILNLPAEATACYNLPCPGSGWEQAYDDERARQAPRLAKLADIAEGVAKNASASVGDPGQAAAAAQAISGLRIIEVSALIQVQPANNPDCYNLPCPSDVQAANQTNGLHVSEAYAIVEAAQRSGL